MLPTRATLLLAASALLMSCSKVCGSDEPAAAERLLQFKADVFFDDATGFGASALRDEAAFRALWEHHAETYDIGAVPEGDFGTSQVAIVQWSCDGCTPEPTCAEVQSVTLVDGTSVFAVGGCPPVAGDNCDYSILAAEVWRTDITPVELCEYRECSRK